MIINITEYGAIGDGKTLNTRAIQAAVDACAASGGGMVIIPPGTFVSGTIFLKSNLTFHLEAGAVLLGSPNLKDYCDENAYAQNYSCPNEGWCGAHLLVAVEQENIAVTGPGIIDGNCDAWYGKAGKGAWDGGMSWARGMRCTDVSKSELRPGQLVDFIQCNTIRLENLSLRNSPCWTVFLHGCSKAIVRGLMIDNPVDGQNTDGIDLDCCSQVVVSDCIIRTGDDAITLRASGKRLIDHPEICEDITVSNCILDSSVAGFRIGVGSGIIRNIAISNIVLRYSGAGFLIQSAYGNSVKGVTITDIFINGIRGQHVGYPLHLLSGRNTGEAQIKNIYFNNYHAECCGCVAIEGNSETLPDNIVFQDCSFKITMPDRPCLPEKIPQVFWDIRNSGKICLNNCTLEWCLPETEKRKNIISQSVKDLIIKDCTMPQLLQN